MQQVALNSEGEAAPATQSTGQLGAPIPIELVEYLQQLAPLRDRAARLTQIAHAVLRAQVSRASRKV